MILHELQGEEISGNDFEAEAAQGYSRSQVQVSALVLDRSVARVLVLSRQIKFRFSEKLASDEAKVAARQLKDGDGVVGKMITDVEETIVVLANV